MDRGSDPAPALRRSAMPRAEPGANCSARLTLNSLTHIVEPPSGSRKDSTTSGFPREASHRLCPLWVGSSNPLQSVHNQSSHVSLQTGVWEVCVDGVLDGFQTSPSLRLTTHEPQFRTRNRSAGVNWTARRPASPIGRGQSSGKGWHLFPRNLFPRTYFRTYPPRSSI